MSAPPPPEHALSVDDFDYALPRRLIAQYPAAERGGSRLLRLDASGLYDALFAELPRFISPGDLLVFNDTRVIKARLRGAKETGGQVEVLVERVLSEREVLAQVRVSKPLKAGTRLRLEDAFDAEMLERAGEFFKLRFHSDASVLETLERHGHVPLPPYIAHADAAEDERRYQTVFAANPGAIAAPTAGLHFDEAMLAALDAQGVHRACVTLHVGAGTFQPLRVQKLAEHHMHSEWYDIPQTTVDAIARAREGGKRVIAVGTTSLRALEAAAARPEGLQATRGETDLFITPGYRFRVVDRLLTNFHLPRSTLLMLVSAFAGMEPVRAAYRHAVAERYRFFSYGDAMLIDRAE